MSKKKQTVAGLGAIYARVCGMDVHKEVVVACVRILDMKDGTVQSTLRRFGTMTADLMELLTMVGPRASHARGNGIDGGVLAAGL
jgi:hypothetical protein